MAEIPNIVKQRLGRMRHLAHLDADLLTAFAEHRLRGREREQVLMHLAECAECREVTSLTANLQAEETSKRQKRAAWWNFGMLRWAGVAAMLVVGVALIVSYPKFHLQRALTLNVPASPKSEGARGELPSSEASRRGVYPGANHALAGMAGDRESPTRLAQRAPSNTATAPSRSVKSSESKRRDENQLAFLGPPPSAEPTSSSAAAEAKDRKSTIANGALSRSAGSNVDLLQQRPGGGFAQAPPKAAEKQAATTAEVAGGPVVSTPSLGGTQDLPRVPAANRNYDNRANETVAAAAATPTTINKETGKKAGTAGKQAEAVRGGELRLAQSKDLSVAAWQVVAIHYWWTISPQGTVQRCLPQPSKDCSDVALEPKAIPRVIAHKGQYVWVGTNAIPGQDHGFLFYSDNNGSSFSLVQGPWKGDVVRINLASPGDVTIATSSKQQWHSSDNGTNWSPFPPN